MSTNIRKEIQDENFLHVVSNRREKLKPAQQYNLKNIF